MEDINRKVMRSMLEGPKLGPIVMNGDRLGRNEKCSCGSGKKFKNCHYAEYTGQKPKPAKDPVAPVPVAAAVQWDPPPTVDEVATDKPLTFAEVIEKARGGPAPAPIRAFA